MASIIRDIKRDVKKQLAADRKQIEDDLAKRGMNFAKNTLSAGKVSTKQLRKQDHPYAKRHGSPQLRADVINDQKGIFKRGWKIKKGTGFWKGVPILVNESPVAKYLQEGTKHMFARPLEATVIKFVTLLTPSVMRKATEQKKEIKP